MLRFQIISQSLAKRSFSTNQRGAMALLLNEYGEILVSNRRGRDNIGKGF